MTNQSSLTTRHDGGGKLRVAVFPPDQEGGEPVTALVKIDGKGEVRSYSTRLRLSESKGEVYRVPAKDQQGNWIKKPVMTAAAYDRANQFVGVSFVAGDVLAEDGTSRKGSYIHKENGQIRYVKVRRIGIGRNPTGNLVAIDYTLTYDLTLYFAQDVWSKWKGRGSNPKTQQWGELYDADSVPDEIRKNPKRKLVDCPGGVVLALDLESRDVIELLQDHINRTKFAERNAITICKRNILKQMVAASVLDDSLTVALVAWRQPDRDMIGLARIAESADSGKLDLEDGESVQVTTQIETAEAEDVEVAEYDVDEDNVVEEVDEPVPAGVDSAVTEVDLDQELLKSLRLQIRTIFPTLPDDIGREAMESAGFESFREVAQCDDVEKLRAALAALNERVPNSPA